MADENWLEEALGIREERIYPALFGSRSNGIYPLDAELFSTFHVSEVDPRWLFHGVMKFGPVPERDSWIYATSGLSNAWHDQYPNPEGWSGIGCELVLETKQEADWALFLLRRLLAFQTLLGWGHFPEKSPLAFGDRIPLRSPIDGEKSALSWGLVAKPLGYADTFELPTGKVELLLIVGITEDEAAFAREMGLDPLLKRLGTSGYLATDPARTSVLGTT